MQDTSTEIAAELAQWSPEERVDAGEAIKELEQMPGFEIYRSLSEGVRKRKLNALLTSSKPREASEYARDLGEINGLSIVDAITETVKAKARDADKELEQRLAGAAAEAR